MLDGQDVLHQYGIDFLVLPWNVHSYDINGPQIDQMPTTGVSNTPKTMPPENSLASPLHPSPRLCYFSTTSSLTLLTPA